MTTNKNTSQVQGSTEKTTAQKLLAALSAFRTIDPDMAMGVMVAFLVVAQQEDEIEVRKLQTITGMSHSALNRALTYLGDQHWSRTSAKGGLGLVDQRISPADRRVRLAKLSPKGRAFYQNLEGII